MRRGQQEIADLADGVPVQAGPEESSPDDFLAALRTAWTDGEVRPTSRPEPRPKRGRRRPDPLEKVTDQLRTWFDAEPWAASRQLPEQLQEEHPGPYPDNLLRTLRRRVKIRRQERVREVIFGSPAIESAPREDRAHADAIAAPEFETAQRKVPGVMERKRRQAATAGRPAVAACGPDHTPGTGFRNHRVFGNILDEAKVQPRVTFSSEAIRAVTSYGQNQGVEKKRKLYIVPRAFPWKTPRLPCRFHVSILHTGSPLPAVTD